MILYFCTVLLDRKNSTLAIQTCDDVTPCEVLLITVDTRSGEFRVALGSGEGRIQLVHTMMMMIIISDYYTALIT